VTRSSCGRCRGISCTGVAQAWTIESFLETRIPMDTTDQPLDGMATTLRFSPRINSVAQAREMLANDFFGGWQPSDLELFERHHHSAAGQPGFVTDYFGVKTASHFVPWAAGNDGAVLTDPPVPDDTVRAEAIEYFALLDALERSSSDEFSMVELGASYAPWACMAGVLAMRQRRSRISVRAVEASRFFFDLIDSNFAVNGLVSSDAMSVRTSAVHAAVGIKRGTAYFPMVRSAFENGGQVADTKVDVDYIGRAIEHEAVKVCTLDDVFDGFGLVDLLHCDIQGAEADVMTYGAGMLTQKVRRLFVGTHSRHIEGLLIDCFHKHGWRLERERPCAFTHRSDLTSPVGMTTRDGGQYWVNSRLVS
jgi:FkbM family methyltransferase